MLILALDSSTSVGAISIHNDEGLVAEYNLNLAKTHSQRLMPQIISLMDDVGVTVDDLDGIVVGIGPGSFTGIRIGLATAKSLAQSLEIPIISLSTLDILANELVYIDEYICPIIDARRNRVYTALYHEVDKLGLKKKASKDQMLEVKELAKIILQELSNKVIFIGPATKVYQETIEEILGEQAIFIPNHYDLPRGAVLGRIGSLKLKAGSQHELMDISPNYLKRAQAEIDWERKVKKES
ncbi:tRNA (adenosine(37)-N6)-threonylcarbamoyltransferase complex dimerization subunit type 1 TsaB [Selenihalanaerobacter shriftii]|uniref:tRNA threonylcarbamoyladenosine biosynthesis protein TsaB n=1 Tax=Selenihalanaerobacter shriftii TaxID=142842 RepID=A0A1T4JW19_9FIRM|nr:tRNA (adenosine(37)-N6)-threonylcarbamoyltransferase complex dimerization subunit type 1 TsaB [Selenihalanaerobacter shriftii]SJZ34348.1 tRNA threonylcarbamoyladenosine biosynthesis protein TsaB [Selenihalanaerobacter shriftii]